jgi:electron transfer flavoprotein beta subunit
MRIIVPIKQVPESGNVKMDPETGTIIRAGVESVVNPLDLYALETALRIRESRGGVITAVTMGPEQAKRVLKEAIAMGCDGGVLVSDRVFGGSDSWATSYTLAQGIKKLGDFDLIVTGERATDGDTAQVGPGIAAWLGVPVLTYVSKIEKIEDGRIKLERLTEEGYQQVDAPLPCLVSVLKEIGRPRLPTLKGKIASTRTEIGVFNSQNMELDLSCLGLKGSPTRVTKIESPKVARNGRVLVVHDETSLDAAVDELALFLEERGII